MITAILTSAVLWCMFYARVRTYALVIVCIAACIVLAALKKRVSTRFSAVDVFAQTSRLKTVNPMLKFITVLLLMVLCVWSKNHFAGIFLAAAAVLLTVLAGGLRLVDYLHLLSLPVSFLMLSGLALLFEVTAQKTGVISLPAFGYWISVTTSTQAAAALVTARALGAVSCLYMLSLTTPMPELIGVLLRIRCPGVIIELMYLIYRYIFIIVSMRRAMVDAAASRLGFSDFSSSIRTTGSVYTSLLSRSYRQANKNFDAMESRCYGAEIRFLENSGKLTPAHVAAAVVLSVITLGLALVSF